LFRRPFAYLAIEYSNNILAEFGGQAGEGTGRPIREYSTAKSTESAASEQLVNGGEIVGLDRDPEVGGKRFPASVLAKTVMP
jgi:hypothetical protein